MSWLLGLAALSLNSPALAVPWLGSDPVGASSVGPPLAVADGSLVGEPAPPTSAAEPARPQPLQAQPTPAQPTPVQPTPAQPPPTASAPAELAPTDSKAADSTPADSTPADSTLPGSTSADSTPPERPPGDATGPAAATPAESPSLTVGDGSLTSSSTPDAERASGAPEAERASSAPEAERASSTPETESASSAPASPQSTVEPNLMGLNGRIRVGLALLGSAHGGNLSSNLAYGAAGGLGPAVDVGFGLNRNTALGLYGNMTWFGSGSSCGSCSAFVAGGGAFVRHHLVQGLRLDPWVSYGLGVKAWEISQSGANDSATALEWLRASVGADWFAGRGWFFGPYLQLSLSSTVASNRGNVGEIQYEGGLGLRIGFDAPTR